MDKRKKVGVIAGSMQHLNRMKLVAGNSAMTAQELKELDEEARREINSQFNNMVVESCLMEIDDTLNEFVDVFVEQEELKEEQEAYKREHGFYDVGNYPISQHRDSSEQFDQVIDDEDVLDDFSDEDDLDDRA